MIKIIEHRDNGIDLISLKNETLEVIVSNYGCTITHVLMKDKDSQERDVVLGYDDFTNYQTQDGYLGALVGRVANRIKGGCFKLNDKEYHLAINNGPNHLHGGNKGFSYQVFDYKIQDDYTIVFTYISKDGEEGYPGNLKLEVIYTLKENTFLINYHAISDQDTLINITNHSYFNLSGKKENIYHHELQVLADKYMCVDSVGLATGEIQSVAQTPFDFRKPKLIKESIEKEDKQLKQGNGFDHHFIFNKDKKQVSLFNKESGIKLVVTTTLPGAQIYTANYLDGRLGKHGQHYYKRDALCIETQNVPDAIHLEKQPTTILRKGDVYDETTSYTFEVIK